MSRDILDLAADLGLPKAHTIPWGREVARVDPDAIKELPKEKTGVYVLVTAMTPTRFGEGKTTTSIGLAQAMTKIGKRCSVNLRQSSLGPTFGMKGGGAGGGACRLRPFNRSLLHLTGDLHAIAQAHNLLVALLDNQLHRGNPLDIDPENIPFLRVLDVNDRALRGMTIGDDGAHGAKRDAGFEIVAASELLAVLALVDGGSRAEVMHDLRARIAKVILGFTRDGAPVTAEDIGGAGGATALLADSISPNLMQTTEGTLTMVHTGPFANIAHGCSSIIADHIALRCAEVVITEAGFGMDIGGEKFFDIKCRTSGDWPDVAVLVATVRACRVHAGQGRREIQGGHDPEAVRRGAANVAAQIENARRFGVPVVVAINAFDRDSPQEHAALREVAMAAGAADAVVCTGFRDGGEGAIALAEATLAAVSEATPKFLYPLDAPIEDKLRAIATSMYRAADVSLSPAAREVADFLDGDEAGRRLAVCVAKTSASLSADPKALGVPTGHTVDVRNIRVSAGAGFAYAVCGPIQTMPGMGAHPAALDVDIDENGEVIGLR